MAAPLEVRIGVFLSGLAILIECAYAVWALAVATEWWPVILIYLGLYILGTLAFIWLGVFVVHVIAKGVRVTDEARKL